MAASVFLLEFLVFHVFCTPFSIYEDIGISTHIYRAAFDVVDVFCDVLRAVFAASVAVVFVVFFSFFLSVFVDAFSALFFVFSGHAFYTFFSYTFVFSFGI